MKSSDEARVLCVTSMGMVKLRNKDFEGTKVSYALILYQWFVVSLEILGGCHVLKSTYRERESWYKQSHMIHVHIHTPILCPVIIPV